MMRTFTFVVLVMLGAANRTNASLTLPFKGPGELSEVKLNSETLSADTALVSATSVKSGLSFQELLFSFFQ